MKFNRFTPEHLPSFPCRSCNLPSGDLAIAISHRVVFLMFLWVFVAIVCFYRILNAKTFYKKNIWNRKRNTIHLIFDLTGHSRRKKCPLLSIHAKSNAKWNFQFMFHFSCFSFLLLLLFNVHWNFVCMHVSSADMHRMDKRQRGRGGREWCEERELERRKTFEQKQYKQYL